MEKAQKDIKEEKVLDMFNTISTLFDIFIGKFENNYKKSVYLNKDLLLIAVGSYFDDYSRNKDRSESLVADRHIRAGYIIKWLSKIRPIQIVEKPSVVDKYVLLINSSFSIFVCFTFLDIPKGKIVSPEYFNHLLYITEYENLSGKELASTFYVLEKCAKGKGEMP